MEYAIEAINNAGTCLALQSSDGVVLAAERKVVSKLLAPSKTSEKTYTIDNHVVCLVAGLTSDANILINQARLGSQRFEIVVCVSCESQWIDVFVYNFSLDTYIVTKNPCLLNK